MRVTISSRYILLAEDNPAYVWLVREALEDRAVNCDLHVISDGAKSLDGKASQYLNYCIEGA